MKQAARSSWSPRRLAAAMVAAAALAACTADPAGTLDGTVWSGTDSDGDDYTWRFHPGGGVTFTSPSGTSTDASWWQDGAMAYWETSDHYSEYEAVIAGETMDGSASNVAGHAWTFSLARE